MLSNRRLFLRSLFGTACGLPAVSLMAPLTVRRAYGQTPAGTPKAQSDFARIEELADGVYALVSTPFKADGSVGNTTTHSNGGLIVGTDRILAIDSYRTTQGARFVAQACLELTGRLPTHVVHTHFHFDHLGGTQGFISAESAPEIIMTEAARNLALDTYRKTTETKDKDFTQSALNKWGGRLTDATRIIPAGRESVTLDLGGRSLTISQLSGHTDSDVVVVDVESGILFGGDLIWDGIFPNFMSSTPSVWRKTVTKLLEAEYSLIVPGHGNVLPPDAKSFANLQVLMDELEVFSREANLKGWTVDEAAARFKLTPAAGDWQYFREGFHEMAIDAWFRDLGEQ